MIVFKFLLENLVLKQVWSIFPLQLAVHTEIVQEVISVQVDHTAEHLNFRQLEKYARLVTIVLKEQPLKSLVDQDGTRKILNSQHARYAKMEHIALITVQ